MVYTSTIFDPLLNPILNAFGPLLSMIIISLFVAFLTTLIYRYATDQQKMKSLKSSMKRYRKKISKVKDDPDKAMKLQKEMMKLNGDYMKNSFKSMIFTIVPVMLFLGWFAAHFAFNPILPGEEFNITVDIREGVSGSVELFAPDALSVDDDFVKNISGSNRIVWTGISSGEPGEYDLSVIHNGTGEEKFFSVIITERQSYATPKHVFEEDESRAFSSISIGMDKLLMFEDVPVLGSLPLIKKAGWLGAYILFSIIFTSILRKLFDVA